MLFLVFMDPFLCAADLVLGAGAFELDGVRIGVLAYADDVALLALSAAALQRALNRIYELLAACAMRLNVRKCEYAVRAPAREAVGILCAGEPLPVLRGKQAWRYLGVHFDMQLSWSRQRSALVQQACSMTSVIARRALTGAQAVYYIRTVVLPALLYRLALGGADKRCIARLQSICERAVRQRAWLPRGICVEALRLPLEHSGLGLGLLAAEVDGALIQLARTTLQQPTATPARLLCAALIFWREAYALPCQPWERLQRLPFAVTQHMHSSRSFVHAVAGALARSRMVGMRVALVPDRLLPPASMRIGGSAHGTPLCDLIPAASWKQLHRDCAKHGLYALEQVASADGRQLATHAAAGIPFKARGEPKFWKQLRQQLANEQGMLHTPIAACVLPGAALPAAVSSHASALEVYSATTRDTQPLPAADSAVIYTDGSAARNNLLLVQAGAAAVAFAHNAHGPSVSAEAQVRVAGQQTSYKAELLAVLQALRSASTIRQLVIRSDCMAAIAALRAALDTTNRSRTSAARELRQPCVEIVREIATEWRRRGQRGFSTRIVHVRAHCGEVGNEHADRVAAVARSLPAQRRAGLQFCGGVRTVCVAGSGCRLEGDVRQYVRQQAVLAMLEQRNAHREQGAAFAALTEAPSVSVSEPWADLELQLRRFPVLPAASRPKSSADWRVWGRRMHAVVHQAMPTRKWLWHRKRADTAACNRAAHNAPVADDTCAHAVHDCDSSAEMRAARDEALMALYSSDAAVKLRRDFARLQLDRVLMLPVPVAMVAGDTRAVLERWEPWRRACAMRVLDGLHEIQREFALSVWRRLRAGAGSAAGDGVVAL
jgi:ribonuclease HI